MSCCAAVVPPRAGLQATKGLLAPTVQVRYIPPLVMQHLLQGLLCRISLYDAAASDQGLQDAGANLLPRLISSQVQAARGSRGGPLPTHRSAAAQQRQLTVCQARPPRPPQKIISSGSSSKSSSEGPSSVSIRVLNTRIKTAQSADELLQLVCDHHATFDAIHTSTAWNRLPWLVQSLGQHSSFQHPGYSLLLSLAEQKASGFNEHSTANVLWALAKLGQEPSPQLLSRLEAAVQRNLKRFNGQGLANSIWSLATMRHDPGSELLAAIAEQAAIIYGQGQVISMTAALLCWQVLLQV